MQGLFLCLLSVIPSKFPACHLVELHVERPVEVSKSLYDLRVNVWMGPPFGFTQAMGLAAALCLFETREALGLVEVEVFVCDDPLEPQEVLHAAQFSGRVADQPLSAHEQDLAHGEKLQPVVQVFGVDADLNGAPRGVDQSCSPVFERQALKSRNVKLLGQCLRVVRDGSSDGVPDHHDQLGVTGHGVDPGRSLAGHKVAWCFLHGDLALQGFRH